MRHSEDFLELAEQYIHGETSAEQVATLGEHLLRNTDATRYFLRIALLNGQLSQLAAAPRAPAFEDIFADVDIRPIRPHRSFRAAGVAWWLTIVATMLVAGLGVMAWPWFTDHDSESGPVETASSDAAATNEKQVVGHVKATRYALASSSGHGFLSGQTVQTGRIAIDAGALEIELVNGVVVVLHGPGEIELVDALHGFLHSGAALVRVPKGMTGYRLDTATTEVLDLGTEFAVRTDAGLTTDVQVFDGAVVATSKTVNATGGFPRRLGAGEARRFRLGAADGEVIPYSESRFVRYLPAEQGIEHTQWKEPDEEPRRFGRPRLEAIRVMRAIRAPLIDGRLDDWQVTGGFRATLNGRPHDEEWVDARMAFDDQFLYIAARVGDPMPMQSRIDPDVDPEMGWQGGGVQVRLSTDRAIGWPADANTPSYYRVRGLEPTGDEERKAENPRLVTLTMWYHSVSRRPCLTINHGMAFDDRLTNPAGAEGCFRLGDDGRHYTLEYAIPWDLLNAASDPPRSGDTLAANWQVHWSDASGLIWRDQLLEIRNLHEPRRILTFERAATWGRAEYE